MDFNPIDVNQQKLKLCDVNDRIDNHLWWSLTRDLVFWAKQNVPCMLNMHGFWLNGMEIYFAARMALGLYELIYVEQ